MHVRVVRTVVVLSAVATAVACGGSTSGVGASDGGDSDASDGGGSADGSRDASIDSGGSDSSDGATPDAGDSASGDGGVPLHHRPDDSQCSQAAPAGNCTMMGIGACSQDSQCTMGTNGRCIENSSGARICRCSYDTCVHDTDCPMGQLCVCHGSAYTGGAGNTCIAGNCRIDADCGAGKYCSPSHGATGCGAVTGYYCHSSADTCVNDSDCTSTMGPEVCAWSTTSNRWTCQQQQLCP